MTTPATAENIDLPITFTGHSLGGGLASLAALVTGRTAITFNAASLSNATLVEYAISKVPRNNIYAFAVKNDPLTFQQDWNPFLNRSQGIRIPIVTPYLYLNIADYRYHMINTVLEALGY